MAHRNGFIPSRERNTIPGTSMTALIASVNAFLRMQAAARREGVRVYVIGPIGAYRNWFVQVRLQLRRWWKRYNVDPLLGVHIAPPGSSNHGFGVALDIGTSDVAWLRANMHRFGFSLPFGNADRNHYLHDGHTAGTALASVTSSTHPVTIPEETLMRIHSPHHWYNVGETTIVEVNQDTARAFNAGNNGVPYSDVTSTEAKRIFNAVAKAATKSNAALIDAMAAEENDGDDLPDENGTP